MELTSHVIVKFCYNSLFVIYASCNVLIYVNSFYLLYI